MVGAVAVTAVTLGGWGSWNWRPRQLWQWGRIKHVSGRVVGGPQVVRRLANRAFEGTKGGTLRRTTAQLFPIRHEIEQK